METITFKVYPTNTVTRVVFDAMNTLKERGKEVSFNRKRTLALELGSNPKPLQSTFVYNEVIEDRHSTEMLDPSIDYDYVNPLKVNRKIKVKARVRSVKKFTPKVFFD